MNFARKDFNEKWISDKIEKECITWLENFGLYLCDKKEESEKLGFNAMTATQMRNIFGEVKRIESQLPLPTDKPEMATKAWEKILPDVLLLRPKIAYNTAREISKRRESRIKAFREIMELALKEVDGTEKFRRFAQFFEGIIAYHKVYGGKD
jgi:CRISPR-associated protein Csm2